MFTFHKYLIVLGAVISFNFAHAQNTSGAGLFVEPGVTFERGDTTVTYPSPLSNSTGKADGFGLMGRLGFHLGGVVFLGADARYSMPQFKDSALSYDAKATATNWGPVVGIQMPVVGLRVWGNYILGGELDPEASGNVDVKFKKAAGYRIGAGFKVIFLSINLEYQELKYDQTELQALGPFSIGTNFDSVKLTDKAWVASVSFPINL